MATVKTSPILTAAALAPLTEAERSALTAYAVWAQKEDPKRGWKTQLLDDWYYAGERTRWPEGRRGGDRWCYLQSLRNNFGPAWLETVPNELALYPETSTASAYNLPTPPEGKWSGKGPIPALGDKVTINFNGLGTGTVVSYFREKGTETNYVGVAVRLDKNPDWRKKQGQGVDVPALVFGAELG